MAEVGSGSDVGLRSSGNPEDRRVLAITVAYNSPKALERYLRSLDEQTKAVDGVLIVDNSEPTPVDVSGIDLDIVARTRVLPAGSNMGPAGGFALGLAVFMEDGRYSHAWLMDDDCFAEPTALERLLDVAESTRPGSAVFPSSGSAVEYPAWRGLLLDRLAIRLAGIPRTEMFWWAEDTEYLQFRLPHKGVITVSAPEARVLSDHVRRAGGRPAWKYYYEVRNMIWFRLDVQRGAEAWKLPRTVVGLLGSALLSKGRGQKLRMYAKGVSHGLIGRLGNQVKPPAPAGSSGLNDA